jgi:hypothetical protein
MPFPWDPDLEQWNQDPTNWNTERVDTDAYMRVQLGLQADVDHQFAISSASTGMNVGLKFSADVIQAVGIGATMTVGLGYTPGTVRWVFGDSFMEVLLDMAAAGVQYFGKVSAEFTVRLDETVTARFVPWDTDFGPAEPEDDWTPVFVPEPEYDWELVASALVDTNWSNVNEAATSGPWVPVRVDVDESDWQPVPNPGSEALV